VKKLIVAVAALLAACSSSDKTTGPNGGPPSNVGTYLSGLPSWSQFSPAQPDQDPAPTGAATSLSYDTVASVTTIIDSLGDTATASNVPYVCESTPYSVQKTPQQVVMYDPNAATMYPGGFIQGQYYRDGLGSMRQLRIDQRSPIEVSIPAIQAADNFRTVDTVDQAHVASAIGSIVGNAVANNLQASSSIFWTMDEYSSQDQFALSFGASGRYLGFQARVGGSVQQDASEHTVVAHFYQKMFTVVVQAPSTPAGWFSSAFTTADLQAQEQAGNIGPDNIPVYIGDVVYGRMMMFSITSTASVSDIEGTINASYNAIAGGGSASLSAKSKKILQDAKIEVASVGGPDSATIAIIRSGDWSQYFTVSAPLSTAAPLSYDLYNVADNSLAQVTEATTYNVTTCAQASAGQFDFLPAQSVAAPVPTPFETRLVDVNGDGRQDLVFNHRDANSNDVAVALGQADGTFATPAAMVSHPATPAQGWAAFDLSTGDFNGDGRTDLIWNERDSINVMYVALADGSGGWTFEAPQQQLKTNWPGYGLYVGDLNNDGKADLIWNKTNAGPNWVYTALSNGDGTFALDTTLQVISPGGWNPYHTAVADVNRDGKADLIWNVTYASDLNRTYTALSLGNGHFGSLNGGYDHPTPCCWGGYQTLVGDLNRDQVPDMMWFIATGSITFLHRALGNGAGAITFQTGQDLTGALGVGPWTALTGDVDGDGAADLIVNRLTTTTNTVGVARGTAPGGAVTTGPNPKQVSPISANWNQALPAMVGDVNGDGRADVVWVIPGAPSKLYVARSRAG
jgi:Thiol-activated cytolysin/FG-GAP-like repeat